MAQFQLFGPDHWAVLLVTAAGIGLLLLNAAAIRRRADDLFVRAGLATVIAGNEIASWLSALRAGAVGLPCHLCDLEVVAMTWALLGRNGLIREVAYFWGLAGSPQAILTPDLWEAFPSARWITFFLGHGAIVLAAVYLIVRGRVKPNMRSVWRVWGLTNGYLAVAGILNWTFGSNFGYVARKPDHPSLLDYLGPWPYYLIGVELIALGLFFACWGLSRVVDRMVGESRSVTASSA